MSMFDEMNDEEGMVFSLAIRGKSDRDIAASLGMEKNRVVYIKTKLRDRGFVIVRPNATGLTDEVKNRIFEMEIEKMPINQMMIELGVKNATLMAWKSQMIREGLICKRVLSKKKDPNKLIRSKAGKRRRINSYIARSIS